MKYRFSTTLAFLAAVSAAQAMTCPDGSLSANMNGVDLCCPGTKLSINGEVMCVVNHTTVPVTQPNYTKVVYGSEFNSATPTPTISGPPTQSSGLTHVTPGSPGEAGQSGSPGQPGETGQPGQPGQPGQTGESGEPGDSGDSESSGGGAGEDGEDGSSSTSSTTTTTTSSDGSDNEESGGDGESAAPRIFTSPSAVGLAAAILGMALL